MKFPPDDEQPALWVALISILVFGALIYIWLDGGFQHVRH